MLTCLACMFTIFTSFAVNREIWKRYLSSHLLINSQQEIFISAAVCLSAVSAVTHAQGWWNERSGFRTQIELEGIHALQFIKGRLMITTASSQVTGHSVTKNPLYNGWCLIINPERWEYVTENLIISSSAFCLGSLTSHWKHIFCKSSINLQHWIERNNSNLHLHSFIFLLVVLRKCTDSSCSSEPVVIYLLPLCITRELCRMPHIYQNDIVQPEKKVIITFKSWASLFFSLFFSLQLHPFRFMNRGSQSIWLTNTAVCLAVQIHKHGSCSSPFPSEGNQVLCLTRSNTK